MLKTKTTKMEVTEKEIAQAQHEMVKMGFNVLLDVYAEATDNIRIAVRSIRTLLLEHNYNGKIPDPYDYDRSTCWCVDYNIFTVYLMQALGYASAHYKRAKDTYPPYYLEVTEEIVSDINKELSVCNNRSDHVKLMNIYRMACKGVRFMVIDAN